MDPAGSQAVIETDGKFFRCEGRRFLVRGVTYGTFEPREGDGARFPTRQRIKADFESMSEAGFNTVRIYVPAPDDLLEVAADWSLKVLAGVHWNDWRYLVGSSRRQYRQVARAAVEAVRSEARRLAGHDGVLAVCVGNEIPADVVRWIGADRVSELIAELADTVRAEDAGRLVTYANYPSTEYLSTDTLDFATFNVFLERRADLRRYLTRLHNLAGNRPLVIGELGRHVDSAPAGAARDAGRHNEPGPGGEAAQAACIDEQMATALERGVAGTCIFAWTDEWHVGDCTVEGWRFGLTTADRTPRPSLAVASAWNRRTVADLRPPGGWPSVSVVVCAYNAAETIDECLRHTCALEYEPLEILVVDDGSRDHTAEIVARHPRARLITIDHGGLSVARNVGFQSATSEIVAYLDADAYPAPEWPFYLALGFDSRTVAGVGGPNVSPPADPEGSQRVAAAPGGPAHVLLSDDRAEHVPGCNMAFWRDVLVEAAGFDPIYTAAGDDVDFCWRVLDRDWQIGFHPAALVWHHRRPTARAYLRQQRGYGRAEALVAVRHPDRFSGLGAARWQGTIYGRSVQLRSGSRIYRGAFGAAPFQSIYRGASTALDLLHQIGVPASAALLPTALLGLVDLRWAAPAAVALLFLVTLGTVDARAVTASGARHSRGWSFRIAVALLHLAQPVARAWGRWANPTAANGARPSPAGIEGPLERSGRIRTVPLTGDRSETAERLVEVLRGAGLTVRSSTGWEEPDASVSGSTVMGAELITLGHPSGVVQLRARRRLTAIGWAAPVVVAALLLVSPPAAAAMAGVGVLEAGRGWWRTGRALWRAVEAATSRGVAEPAGR